MQRWLLKRRRHHRSASAVCALLLVACTSSSKDATDSPPAAPGPAVVEPTVVVGGLDGPTQFTDGPGTWLLIAQLAGDEDAKTGQILAVDPITDKRVVLYENLDKPTGVAWLNGFVWIMERRRLVRGEWRGAGTTPSPLTVMVDDLAFNGRSEGTLTVTPDNRILYETTSSISKGEVVGGSGTLWVFDPLTKTSSKVATGLKNAYAQVFLPDGRLLTTEIGDNIDAAPVEEVNVLPYSGPSGSAVDAGWPACPGDKKCAGVVTPIATFDRNTTPTGIAIGKTSAYVALLVTGEIHRFPLTNAGTGRVATTVIASGFEGPHTILRRPDGTLWISEHFADRIVALTVDQP